MENIVDPSEDEQASVSEPAADEAAFEHIPTLTETPPPERFAELPSLDTLPGEGAGLEAVYEVPVKMQAVLGRARMTVAELMQMRPGRVVQLDRKVGEPVDIFVNNRLIARGEVVMVDKALGVTLTEIVRDDD